MNKEILATVILIIAIGALTTELFPSIRHFDPWYHYRIAKYTLEQGIRPSFDPLSNMGEPIIYPPLLHYLLAIPAHTGLSLMLVAQVYPLVAGILSLVFLFLFTKEVFDERTAMLAALLFSLLPFFKATTGFGYCDHDALDYLLILSAFFFLVKAVKKQEPAPTSSPSFKLGEEGWAEMPKEEEPKAEKQKSTLLYYALAGLSVGLFALTWLGFPMLVVIISSFIILSAILNSYLRILDREIVLGFLAMSLVFLLVALPWYGAEILPVFLLALFSTILSYVALKLENDKRAPYFLVGMILLCSLPLLILFRSWIVDAGLTYIGLRDKGTQLEYVAELKTPNFYYVSQNYGLQLLPFLLGLGIFIMSLKEPRRETVFLISSFLVLIFLASSAIRFLQYFGIFVSIFAACFLNRISEAVSASLKKDVFIPVMLLSAMLFFPPQVIQASITDDWQSSLQWLRNNSAQEAVVMNWWDYSPWVNAIAERKTVVNNQPPGRFDDSMVFFGTNNWQKAHDILKKYNVSYVIVNRGVIAKIPAAEESIGEKIDFQTALPVQESNLYSLRFSNKFKTYFDPVLKVAWDEYVGGRKVYYREIGLFNNQLYKTEYFKTNLSGVGYNEDCIYIFSNAFIRMPSETGKRMFFNLMFTESDIPYLELVREEGEVRIYKVLN